MNDVNERLSSTEESCNIIDLNEDPSDLCVLPNGNFVMTQFNSTNDILSVYDKNFNFIERIHKLNDEYIHAFSIVTNELDRIYINNLDKIISTDLEFNYLFEFNSKENQLNTLCYMLFNNESLYICDCNDKCIIIFNSDLKLQTKRYLDIKPVQMQILNSVSCIVPNPDDPFLYFYDLINFTLKLKVDRCSNIIVHENKFFGINGTIIKVFDNRGNY